MVDWDPEEHGSGRFYLCSLTSTSEDLDILLGHSRS